MTRTLDSPSAHPSALPLPECRYYEDLWREGVAELVSHLETEFPSGGGPAAPKKLDDWARLYIAYVQTLHKLCAAHDGVVQPQKRRCLRATLDACMGCMLELRAWLVQLNGGVDVIDLGEQLAAACLTPDALELPIPAYFREVRAEQLAARKEALAKVVPPAAEAALAGAGYAADAGASVAPGLTSQGFATAAAAGDEKDTGAMEQEEQYQEVRPAHPEEQQQPQQAAVSAEEQQASVEHEQRLAAAAVTVQSSMRGWLARRHMAVQRREELEFLGMLPPSDNSRSAALQQRVAAIAAQRKKRQAARQQELEGALVGTKAAVRQQEGFAMKDQIRDKLNDWFLRSRDPESGEYADLPEAAKGGSRDIVHPPPGSAPVAATKASRAGASSMGSGRGGKQQAEAPRRSQQYLVGLREAVQEYMDVWQQYEPADPTLALLPPELQGLPQPQGGSGLECYDAGMVTAEVRPVVFEEVRLEADEDMRCLIQSIKDMLNAGRAERAKNGGPKGKKDGGKDGKKGPGAAAAGGKKATGAAAAAKGSKQASTKDGAVAEELVKKKRKDLTVQEGRSIESIFAELAAAGLVRLPPVTAVSDFLGCDRLAEQAGAAANPHTDPAGKPRAGSKKSNASAPVRASAGSGKDATAAGSEELEPYPEPSLAQARQALVASCVLPLGAHPALSKLQVPCAVLLYGPPGSGKTLAAMVVAHEAGATLFDLSPTATAGKFRGKEIALMVHMVFKAAKAMAPAVVLVEDVDYVFLTDRARAALVTPPGGEPPNRLRKQLVAEVTDLEPADGVLVVCTSRQPQACVKRDEQALRTFIQCYVQLPLPEYSSRLILLQSFAKHEGLVLGESTALLAQLAEGLSSGQLRKVVQQLAARLRPAAGALEGATAGAVPAGGASSLAGQSGTSVSTRPRMLTAAAISEAALSLLPSFAPLSKEAAQELREWTARVHQPLPPEEAPKDTKKK